MLIKCPKCNKELQLNNKTYKCSNNHSFDISKEGYVNLLLNKTDAGDNKEMVNARVDFLSKNYYQFLVAKLVKMFESGKTILDCGCGEGYYTNLIKEKCVVDIYGTDISKNAVLKAAKRNKEKNIIYFVSSIYDLPVNDKSFDYVLNICAPLCESEFIRVLKDNGKIIKVIPAKNHLIELKEFLYKDVYLNDDSVNIEKLQLVSKENITTKKIVYKDDIKNLFMMTPYYYKTKKEDVERLYCLDELEITFSFDILVYEVRND